VATKEYGVVITSPLILRVFRAIISPIVPFDTNDIYGTSRNLHNSSSSCL